MKKGRLVTVIIPTFRDWERLKKCIESLRAQSYPTSLLEVIIVNNLPTDEPPTEFQLPEGFTLINEVAPGSYAARNSAIVRARGSILAFTDSDCIPSKDWIEKAVNYFEEHPDVTRIAGNIKMFYRGTSPNMVEIYDSVFGFRQKQYVELYGFGVTGNMFAFKHLFDAVGLFSADLLSGGDLEWGRRAQAHGSKIDFVGSVVVNHPARYKYSDIVRKTKRVAGGHSKMGNRKPEVFSIIRTLYHGLKLDASEIRHIAASEDLSFFSKLGVFAMRYHLNFLSNLEKVRVQLGRTPERQ